MKVFLSFVIILFSISSFSQSKINSTDSCYIYVSLRLNFPENQGCNNFLFNYNCKPDKLEFKLLNRFGTLVFETTDIDLLWHGESTSFDASGMKINDIMLPEGHYFYVLEATYTDKKPIQKSGYLKINR